MKRIRDKIDQYLLINYPVLWRAHLHVTVLNPLIILTILLFAGLIFLIPRLPETFFDSLNWILLKNEYILMIIPAIMFFYILIILFRMVNIETLFAGKNSIDIFLNFKSQKEETIVNSLYFLRFLLLAFGLTLPFITFIIAQNQLITNHKVLFEQKENILKGYALVEHENDSLSFFYNHDERYGVEIKNITPEKAQTYKEILRKNRDDIVGLSKSFTYTDSRYYGKAPLLKFYDQLLLVKNTSDYYLKNYWALLFLITSSIAFFILANLKTLDRDSSIPILIILAFVLGVAYLISENIGYEKYLTYIVPAIILFGLFSNNIIVFRLFYSIISFIAPTIFFLNETTGWHVMILGFGNPVFCLLMYTLLKPKINRLSFQPG